MCRRSKVERFGAFVTSAARPGSTGASEPLRQQEATGNRRIWDF